MKILSIILFLLHSIIINTQVIDFNNFSNKTMNEVLFNKLNEYAKSHGANSFVSSYYGQKEIYKYLRKSKDDSLLDSLSSIINNEILKKYDTPTFLSVGILDRISCYDFKTYEEIAGRCLNDWKNSPSNLFFLVGWGEKVGVASFYNRRTHSVYLSFAHLGE